MVGQFFSNRRSYCRRIYLSLSLVVKIKKEKIVPGFFYNFCRIDYLVPKTTLTSGEEWAVSEFVEVAEINDIPEGTMKKFMVSKYPIILARVKGRYYAFDEYCPHFGGDLFLGTLKETTLTVRFTILSLISGMDTLSDGLIWTASCSLSIPEYTRQTP